MHSHRVYKNRYPKEYLSDKFSVACYLSPSHRIVSPVVVPSSVVILVGVIETLEEDEDTRNDTSNIQERV